MNQKQESVDMWMEPTIAGARARRMQLTGRVALVPTMGALHEGHVSLMRIAAAKADHVLVSIFVNPSQFGPAEDYEKYPRPLEADLAMCRAAGVAGVFMPAAEQMYPAEVPGCELNVPVIAADLEGALRPSHFAGVCRVVAKLLNILQPDFACFGQKDFQQLRIVQAMVADLNMPVDVVACPTVREADGLAMSSRNRYLNAEQRKRAVGLSKALTEARMLIEQAGEADPAVVEHAMTQVLAAHQLHVDYAQVRHPTTLAAIDCIEPGATGEVVALVAANLDGVRLIDNMLIPVPPSAL
jgi:pantoate--beta-alanine ligase